MNIMADSNVADIIAGEVLKEFEKWPKKRYPLIRSSRVKEWVPLSGIVVQGQYLSSTYLNYPLHDEKGSFQFILVQSTDNNGNSEGNDFKCLAAATGMKCLPHNKIVKTQGFTLHDWHAEILAIRSFNHFLLRECLAIATASSPILQEKKMVEKEHEVMISKYLRRRTPDEITDSHYQPFTLRDDLILHMYCSEAPCGDASMELIMSAKEDRTPWDDSSCPLLSNLNQSSQPKILLGRSYFSRLGCVRRKPSRPDAPLSLSKSCSDKLALKQYTSLLSSITSLLISPENTYLASLILPHSQISKEACMRAFSTSGRLNLLKTGNNLEQSFSGGYRFQQFSVYPTSLEFRYSRRQPLLQNESLSASNIASYSTPYISGTLIGGTLQGRKQFCLRGAPPMCKHQMWKLALEVVCLMRLKLLMNILGRISNVGMNVPRKYKEVKSSELLIHRRRVKKSVRNVLGADAGEDGWVRNTGGEDWPL